MNSNATELLKTQLEFNFGVVSKNINGISHEESMVFPNDEANCMNWVFGHLIHIRNALLQILGENPVWDIAEFSFYDRDETPLNRKSEFINFEELKSYFNESQNRLRNAFSKMNDLKPENIQDLAGLSLHEIYHSGQIGYLRRILGKEGAIK